MSRYKIVIEYDGTGLLGWQKQLDGPSVQEYIETAIYNFSKKQISFDEKTKEFTFISGKYANLPDEHSSIGLCNQSSDILAEIKNGFSVASGSEARSTEAERTLGVREHSSIGLCNQSSDILAEIKNGFSVANGNEARSTEAERTLEVREHSSIELCNQSSDILAEIKNGFSVASGSEARSTEAERTLEVREHSSIGLCNQSSDKNVFIVYGSGRTDAGVHALGQVAHFDLDTEMNEYKLRDAINANLRNLGANVCIVDVEKTSDEFHARFDAKKRSYIYRILNRRAPSPLNKDRVWHVNQPLDIEKMKEGAKHLIGRHDFTSFRATACQAKSPIKTLDKIEISQKGNEIEFYVEGVSFLHHQVRNIVGTLKEVGDGTRAPEDIKKILEAKDRSIAGVTAPACGLYFNQIWY